jgi:5-methylcytosine-specific restriction endonuclease McrA
VNAAKKRALKWKLFAGSAVKPCRYCRRALTFGEATLDHLKPQSKGGGWELSNLALACVACNNARGVIPVADFVAGKRQAPSLVKEMEAALLRAARKANKPT